MYLMVHHNTSMIRISNRFVTHNTYKYIECSTVDASHVGWPEGLLLNLLHSHLDLLSWARVEVLMAELESDLDS